MYALVNVNDTPYHEGLEVWIESSLGLLEEVFENEKEFMSLGNFNVYMFKCDEKCINITSTI